MSEHGDLYDIADAYRGALLARDKAATRELLRAYGSVWQSIRDQVKALVTDATTAEDGIGMQYDRERLLKLQMQVEARIRALVPDVEASIIQEQRIAVTAAQDHSAELAGAMLGTPPAGVSIAFDRVPTSALQDLVGFLNDGSPLRNLLDELGPDASGRIRKALIDGLTTGQGPQTIARSMRDALGGNMQRAMSITRTETLRAYRESSRRFGEANAHVVTGWVWLSRRSRRTCPSCWAMDGTFHRNDEPFGSHTRCACVPTPTTKTWAELGYPDVPETRVDVGNGPDAFNKLNDEGQRTILGPSKYAAFKAGEIDLTDLVKETYSPQWGVSRSEASLSQARAHAAG